MTTQRLRQSIVTLTLWLIALVMQPTALATEGKLVYDKVHSPALGAHSHNLDDNTQHNVLTLPIGQEAKQTRRKQAA